MNSGFSRESKYFKLHRHFLAARDTKRTMTFAEVEDVLGFALPPGARSNGAWWGNSKSGHSQSRAWLLAGWRVVNVDVGTERVTFERCHG